MAISRIKDPVTGNEYSRDESIAGSTYAPFQGTMDTGNLAADNPLAAAPNPTVADAYKGLTLSPYQGGEYDTALSNFGADALKTINTPFDGESEFRKSMRGYQTEVDAQNRLFATQLDELKRDKTADVGRARALEAAGLGSYSGVQQATRQANKPIDAATAASELKIATIMNNARTAANAALQEKQAAKRQGYSDYLSYLKSTDERKSTAATSLAQTILDQELALEDIDPTVLADAAKNYGVTETQLRNAYYARQKELADEEIKRADALASKNLVFDEATGTYSQLTPEYQSLSDGAYLIDPVTGEVIADNPEDFAPSSGGDMDKLLSPTEATALGVPYGTTQAEAAGMGITPTKPTTETQNRDALFASRTRDAESTIENLESEIIKMDAAKFQASILAENTTIGNSFVSDTIRQQRQAERNFLNSVLRRESGAVISPTEFAEGARQYFPRPGDDAGTLEQKRQNREVVIQGLRESSGNAYMPARIRVRTSSGQTGTIDADDFNPATMTKI